MTDIDESSRRAARALGERLARVGQEEPRRASFTDTGTIEQVMSDGTALVSYRGGTIGPLPMTCDCVGATKGRTCVIAIDGPVVRVIGLVARTSADLAVPSHSQPASTVTGTLAVANGGTGATTAAGARSSLGLGLAMRDVCNMTGHQTGSKVFVIGHSELPYDNLSSDSWVRVQATFGGFTDGSRSVVDITFDMRGLCANVAECSIRNSADFISVRRDSSGYTWVYLYLTEEYYTCYCRAAGRQFIVDAKWQTSLPSGNLVWDSGNVFSYAITGGRLYSGALIGSGLKASGSTLSVDNGAYVKLLWSGKTQSAVTLSETSANFRALVVGVCGSDGVTEASTFVWSPNGKTFDVTAAFVVGTSDWRSMRMRFTCSGTSLKPTYNLGQTGASSSSANCYLQYVVGIR